MNIIKHTGWLSSLFFISGSIISGALLENYNSISQTLSEIGKMGSPYETHWQLLCLASGSMLILFSAYIFTVSKKHRISMAPGFFIFSYGLSQFLISLYPSPHLLHNVFGLSMIVGYFSPLMFVIFWGSGFGLKFKMTSAFAFIWILFTIFLNLSPMFLPDLYPITYYGVVQRFLVYSFYIYVLYVNIMLLKENTH